MNIVRYASVCALSLSAMSVAAQNAAPETPVKTPTVYAVRVSRPPVVDGVLDDEAWTSATAIENFTQHDPNDGQQVKGTRPRLSTFLRRRGFVEAQRRSH